jgi:phage shock protein C
VQQRKLRRSRDRWLAGVCGGIAEFFGWSALATRLAFIAVSLLSAAFPGILVYLVLWIVMPPPARGFHLDDYRQQ